MEFNNQFSTFKRSSTPIANNKVATKDIFYQILPDLNGYYLQIVDAKRKPVNVTNYTNYTGVDRQILRYVEAIQQRNALVINWENPENRIYLHEHNYLMPFLLDSTKIIGTQQQILETNKNIGTIKLYIQTTFSMDRDTVNAKQVFDATIQLYVDELVYNNFVCLTDNYALVDNQFIIETQSLGGNFNRLRLFTSTIDQEDLPQFLSLFFSYINEVEVVYDDFEVKFSDEKTETEACLVFERIDEAESLYMRVGQSLDNYNFEFFEQFEVHRIAELNDLDHSIVVKELQQKSLEEVAQNIDGLLKKVTKKDRRSVEAFSREDNLFIMERDLAAHFIYYELPNLLQVFRIYGSDKLKTYRIANIQPKLQLRLEHGIDFLEGEAFLDFEGELVSIFDALTQYSNQNYILLNDGRHAIVNEQYMKKLQRLFRRKKDKVQMSFFDLPLIDELIDEKLSLATFAKSREVFEGFNHIKDHKDPIPVVQAELRPYQQYGYRWLSYLHQKQLGGCLADDMGLGKTLQAITLFAKIYNETTPINQPSLIVMPRTLVFNWENEIRRFAPFLKTYTYYAATRNIEDALQAQIIFTTYAMVRNDIEKFQQHEFYYVVLDESQNIKNIAAQATKAVMLLQCKHRLALSGTPIENNLSELYSLFRFLNPAMFGSLDMFNQYYGTPIQRNNDPTVIKDLRRKIYPFILRRLKKDVLTELPDKIEQTLFVEMSDRQKKFYEQRRQYYQNAIRSQIASKGIKETQLFIFQALMELRQIASIPETKTGNKISSPKVELLIEQLLDAIANGHKILVFVNFLSAIDLIGEELSKIGVQYVSMTGSTHDRKSVVSRFQNDRDCRVFLMTLKTGGTGLNLTAADMVFIFDPWWNQAAENQATDRAHRIGQTQTVLSYKMITRGTIEEKILKLQQLKSQLFDNVIGADSASLKSLTEEDINYILG